MGDSGAEGALRMRDMVRFTGASAPTIHFYAQQRLLPPPCKTAGNQAWYGESTVTRVRWIRELQTDLNLSLRSIRRVLPRRAAHRRGAHPPGARAAAGRA
ncbi:MAG: MerR family transcriptional regulator [Candidatus Dormibacteraeota bacterium]|nr:MerR family transcriptional regulator [Candidatus Dormibacteraeota bacterium]